MHFNFQIPNRSGIELALDLFSQALLKLKFSGLTIWIDAGNNIGSAIWIESSHQ